MINVDSLYHSLQCIKYFFLFSFLQGSFEVCIVFFVFEINLKCSASES